MEGLIATIRSAVAAAATDEQKAAGVHACRTIAAALEAQAGKPITLAGVPAPGPLSGISTTQGLDLVIAKLRSAIDARAKNEASESPSTPSTPPARRPEPPAFRVVNVPLPSRMASRNSPGAGRDGGTSQTPVKKGR